MTNSDTTNLRGKAVVTGGAGFIGSHMVDVLVDGGYSVTVIDSLCGGHERNLAHYKDDPRVCVEVTDIRSLKPGAPAFEGACFVFHFAGIGDIVPSMKEPAEYMDVNIQGTVRVLECARAAGVEKFVYAASSSCYGIADTPTREDHPVSPQYPYALSKCMGEEAVFHWHRVYGLPVLSLRIFNAYGTRVRTTGAYGAVFGKQKLANKPLTVVGDGTQTRDFLYVTDVARAFLAAAESDKRGEVYNVGAGNPQSVNKLIGLVGGEGYPITYIPKRPGEPDCTWADITKTTADLGWAPQVPLQDGVTRMMAEIENWYDAPLWDASSIEQATRDWFKYLAPTGDKK